MTLYWILFRSLTHAQRAAQILERSGFTATMTRAPQGMSEKGCAYAVIVRREPERAAALLRENRLRLGKIFTRTEAGEYREVVL